MEVSIVTHFQREQRSVFYFFSSSSIKLERKRTRVFNPDPAVIRRVNLPPQEVEENYFKSVTKIFGEKEREKEEEDTQEVEDPHIKWLQNIRADFIPVEGHEHMVVLIVSQNGQLMHAELVPPAIEDMEAMPLSPSLPRPMPYGRYRTSIEDTRHIKKVALADSNDMPVSSLPEVPEQQSKQ